MDHVLSTHLFVNHRLNTVWLDKIRLAGVPAVEIFCARQHLDYRDRAQINELGHWFRASEMKLHSLHSPLYSDDVWGRSGPNAVINITEPVKSKRLQMIDEIKRALDIADVIPFRYLIQHLGVAEEEYDEFKVDAAFTALEEINLFARERGVEVLLENIPNQLSSAERLLTFLELDALENELLPGCRPRQPQRRCVHRLRDFERTHPIHAFARQQRQGDSHLFPFFSEGGTIDWKATMECCARAAANPLLLELRELPEFLFHRRWKW